MSQLKSEKPFDCIRMKREIQSKIYEEIKGRSAEEQIAYFRRATEEGPLSAWWKAARKANPKHAV